MSFFQIIRANGSSKMYSSFIQMLRDFDREDLETLWKLVKAKHGYTRPKEGYERVLCGDLKTMFEPDVEDMQIMKSLNLFYENDEDRYVMKTSELNLNTSVRTTIKNERWNQMHEPNQEATLTLRPRSPVARRQRERVMEFEEASNMEGSRRRRNAKGIWPSEIEAENRGVNLPSPLAVYLGTGFGKRKWSTSPILFAFVPRRPLMFGLR
ncbi:hypothetical protein Tco_0681605 [Tanacetum coccineum]|uniref:Uncharacterized protein n=1 Tax=Tanacetum coccineum TaxID=301880 RepID=A0ABQ4XPR5_9ASTR